MRIGAAEVRTVLDGTFMLDGGAMFGIVPQAVWRKTDVPDAENRIPLALRCLYIEVDDRRILVDTGIGTKWRGDDVERYGIDHSARDLVRSLEAIGVSREDVTDVVLTHLHFDHAGGTTRLGDKGDLEITFPKARHHLQRRNLMHAMRPTARDRGSYLGENFRALVGRRELCLLDGPTEIAAGVDTILFEGHTVGQQLVRVRDPRPNGKWLLYTADIIPTSSHLGAAFVMGYDLMPDVTAREKTRIVERAEREGGVIAFEHDPRIAACTIGKDSRGRPIVQAAFETL
jgi:glyoxylase-like metal-dependent hydrolase (beta-lactamase superfamily II)